MSEKFENVNQTPESELSPEETEFGTFQAYKDNDGYFFKFDEGGKVFRSSSLDELRYHWYVDKMEGKWEGAHGSIQRLDDAKKASESGEKCPVSPDPREEAKEWGISSPY